jgi:hypothetical protein
MLAREVAADSDAYEARASVRLFLKVRLPSSVAAAVGSGALEVGS